MKLSMDHDEKNRVSGIVKVWDRSHMTQEVMRDIQRGTGVPARLVETVFHQVDTLDALSGSDWLVFKGGTCVQSHLPHDKQRASVDLDFNSTIGNPNSVLSRVDELNDMMRGEGRAAVVHDVEFGTFEYRGTDTRSGTIDLVRRMPSRFGEFERAGDDLIQSKNLRVQINYKHSWLPCLETVQKDFEPFILEFRKPARSNPFPHSSPQDLLSDKIMTTAVIGSFGRERYKDIYDLYQLFTLGGDRDIVLKKLGLVSSRSGLTVDAILSASIETVSRFADHPLEAKGFMSMVCKGGRKDMGDWERVCEVVVEGVKGVRKEGKT